MSEQGALPVGTTPEPRRAPRPVVVVEDSDEDFEALTRALGRVTPSTPLLRFVSSQVLFEHELLEAPLLVLLDLNLPGENGLRTLHRLRSHPGWRLSPVVIFSGSNRREDVLASYVGGAAGYLVKPFDPGDLVPQMQSLWTWWGLTVEPPPSSDRLVWGP